MSGVRVPPPLLYNSIYPFQLTVPSEMVGPFFLWQFVSTRPHLPDRDRISDVLPGEFDFSHDFAFLLHDSLAQFLTWGMGFSPGRFPSVDLGAYAARCNMFSVCSAEFQKELGRRQIAERDASLR